MRVSPTGPLTGSELLYRRLEQEAQALTCGETLALGVLEPANGVDYGRLRLKAYPVLLVLQHTGTGFIVTHACYGCSRSLLFQLTPQGQALGSCSHCGPVEVAWSTLFLDAGRENRGTEKLLSHLLLTRSTGPLEASVAASELINFLMAWREAYWELEKLR